MWPRYEFLIMDFFFIIKLLTIVGNVRQSACQKNTFTKVMRYCPRCKVTRSTKCCFSHWLCNVLLYNKQVFVCLFQEICRCRDAMLCLKISLICVEKLLFKTVFFSKNGLCNYVINLCCRNFKLLLINFLYNVCKLNTVQ